MPYKRSEKGARLVSLAELVREYKIGELVLLLNSLASLCRELQVSDRLVPDVPVESVVSDLAACLGELAIFCANCDVDSSLVGQINDFRVEIVNGRASLREAVLHARLKAILIAVERNLNSRKFMYVPVDQAPYWNNFFWLGNEFLVAFTHPAKKEAAELGSCITAGRWTACVFHSMRLTEHGLRKLAKSVKVTLKDKGKVHPIEYADWNKIINSIKAKITTIRQRPVGPKKDKELQFYSDCNDHCEYMKDIWRNEVSHTRRFYEKDEAFGVINRTREFIQLLSKYYAEKATREF